MKFMKQIYMTPIQTVELLAAINAESPLAKYKNYVNLFAFELCKQSQKQKG